MQCDAVAVELTGSGRGGVATVGVRGKDALAMVQRCFAAARGDRPLEIEQVRYGQWVGPHHDGEKKGASESVVVTLTGPNTIELHCHGGRAAVASILADLQAAGASLGEWSDWLRMAQKPTLEAEAECVLVRTTTRRTASIALAQCQGAMRRCVENWLRTDPSERWSEVASQIDEVLGREEIGLHLVTPWKVVLAGPPNVGKSSLLNALVGYRRAITFDAPGTTRDVVAVETVLDGWPVQLSDTAGIRISVDGIEQQGVKYAQRTIGEADLVVWVTDAREPLSTNAVDVSASGRSLWVRNKADLLEGFKANRQDSVAADETAAAAIYTVALPAEASSPANDTSGSFARRGLQELASRIMESLIGRVPAADAAVPLTPRQLDLLREARAASGLAEAAPALRKLLDDPAWQPLPARHDET